MTFPNADDKDLVICAVFIICVMSIFLLPLSAKDIILNGFSGMFGIAVGSALPKKE